jgi:NADH-quinone oxidoreductase subunit E
MSITLKDIRFNKVCEILKLYKSDPTKLIPILQAIQEEYRYLPEEIMTFVATSLNIPPARIFGVATFYSHFALKPKGKHIIRICDGTACHVKKSDSILEALRRYLKLTEEKSTTNDMLFTIETVSCLGACGLAPVFLINDDVYGQMTAESAIKVLADVIRKEKDHAGE